MSDHTPASSNATDSSHSETAVLTPDAPVEVPDFTPHQVVEFGKEDGAAVTVIGKMLVVFFFYSLVIMLIVNMWTRSASHPTLSPDQADEAAEELDTE